MSATTWLGTWLYPVPVHVAVVDDMPVAFTTSAASALRIAQLLDTHGLVAVPDSPAEIAGGDT